MRPIRPIGRIGRIAAALLWMALIYYGSSRTGGPKIELAAILGHFIEYGVLAFLYYFALQGSARRFSPATATVAILLATLYGVTDEWHQTWVPNRTSDPMDIVTDLAGAAAMMGVLWARRLRDRELET